MSENSFRITAPPLPGETAATEFSTRLRVPWVISLWGLFLLSFALLSLVIASPAAILYSLATLTLFTLPGYFITPILFGTSPELRPVRFIVGAVFGITISSYAAVIVGFLYGWHPKAIAFAILALACVCAFLGRIFRRHLCLPVRDWTATDHAILAGIGIILVLFTARPALRLGQLTSHGFAYTWLYGLDFLWRADQVRAMTLHLPPDAPWMTGVPLHIYLVSYAMPAFAYSAGKTISLHSVLLIMTLCSSFLLLACLYLFLRTLFSEAKVLLFALFTAFFAYSFYWVYDAAKASLIGPNPGFRVYGSVSHHLQRTLLVEPQAALATSLLLIVLSLLVLARYRLNDYVLASFVGICLGISFGAEAMESLLAIAWFGILFLGRVLLGKASLRHELGPFLSAVLPCGAICSGFLLLGMFRPSTSHLSPIGVNWWILKFGAPYFLVEFGPLLLLGLWGIIRWWRGSREDFGWPLLLLGVLALSQLLLVHQRPATRMADRMFQFVLLPFAAYLFSELIAQNTSLNSRSLRLLAAVLLLGVPTFFTDIYFTSANNNVPETYYVRPADMEACQWIRQNLPQTAVIQGVYNYFAGPDRGLYLSLIASFAERPQLLGWAGNAAYMLENGANIAEQRRLDIDASFASHDASSLLNFARKYSVDYFYVGPSEQAKYPQLLSLLRSAPAQFREVYSRDSVSLFRFLGDNTSAADGIGSSMNPAS